MTATSLTLQHRPADPSVDHAIQAIVAGASTAETCNTDLAEGPWNFDARPGYGPGSSSFPPRTAKRRPRSSTCASAPRRRLSATAS
jgi:hypothetical protein